MSFHSQSQLDNMPVTELISAIKKNVRVVGDLIENDPPGAAWDALDYVQDLINLANELREHLEKYTKDEE